MMWHMAPPMLVASMTRTSWTTPSKTGPGLEAQKGAVWRWKVRMDTPSSLMLAMPRSQASHDFAHHAFAREGRARVVEAPQPVHRHRLVPALVVPFIFSVPPQPAHFRT